MTYKRGDKVIASRSLGMGSVPKGTGGTVQSTSFLGSYTVSFGNGRTLHSITRDDLQQPAAAGPLGAGCLIGPTMALIAGAVLRAGRTRKRK